MEIPLTQDDDDMDDETFMRKYSLCEEDRLAKTGVMRTGLDGPRWFRSPNVVCLEKVRAVRAGNRAELQAAG